MTYTPAKNRYDSVEYNRCGKSGLKLPAVSLGLWHNFGGINDFDHLKSLLFYAFDAGITHFDLANNYGPPPGSAESNFGKVLKDEFSSYRDEMIISTKAGYDMWPGPYGEWGSKKYLIASLDQSLQRMGLEYVDIFYSHRPDPDTPFDETMQALDQAVRSGKALYVGLSNYSADQTKEAVAILDSLGTKCLIHQPKYSMFERWVEKGLLDVLEEKGIGCIPFSPLAQGLLSDKYIHGIPEDSRIAGSSIFLNKENLTEEKLDKIIRLNTLATDRGQSLAQMALSWLLKNNTITSVLIGASKTKQIQEAIEATKKCSFSEDELKDIEAILS